MTYSTLSLREYPAAVTPAELECSATKSTRLKNMDELARDCAPYKLADWAKSKEIPVFYIDNCWVRVPVSAAQLGEFAADVLGSGSGPDLISQAPGAEGLVVIEAEEW